MTIRAALASEFERIAGIWEDSVRATHDFLADGYVGALRPRIRHEWLPAVDVSVYVDSSGEILGFSGVADRREGRGKGTGGPCHRGKGGSSGRCE